MALEGIRPALSQPLFVLLVLNSYITRGLVSTLDAQFQLQIMVIEAIVEEDL